MLHLEGVVRMERNCVWKYVSIQHANDYILVSNHETAPAIS